MRLNNVSQQTAACPMSVVGILMTYVAAMFAIILAGAPAHAQRESLYVKEAVEGAAGWTFQKYYFELDEFTDSAETGYVKITLSKTGGLQMLLRTYCDRPRYCKSEFAVIHWEAEAVSPGYSDMRVRVDRKPFEIYRVRNSGVTNFWGDYYQQVSIATCATAVPRRGAVSGGASPDPRASPIILSDVAFEAVVRKGTLVERGMPAFPDLSNRHLEALQHYIRQRARISLGLLGDGH
ncbi:MAG: hypothetical protein OXH09_17045 [Gammaproteobacteria bacterium]|nr:hypothetical protein [Gammaproteobacteria bacterium]